MPEIIRTPESENDLTEIAIYIANDSVNAAMRWIDLVDSKLRVIVDTPGIGQKRDDLSPGLRSYPLGNYLIFYRPTAHGIEVVRVLHGARRQHRSHFH
jgi:toxin ParE1/3/4